MISFPKVEKTNEEQVGAVSAYKELLLNRWAYLFFLGIFAYVGFEQGIGNWMAQYLRAHHHYVDEYIGTATVSYFWAMLTVGS